ncbi:AAA family ATPase [Larkinella sp. VNQ87]|uniref:AAA family ATPase n=1 Tax=Larkinella sp. VNQ87 TaxID=3400921 RepID=UPI003C0BC4FB
MLKRVSIQNFKSLKDVTLDLQKVNLLIGPNNSGKTNFLKAFSTIEKVVIEKEDIDYDDHYKKDFSEAVNIHLTYIGEHGEYDHVILDWVDDENIGEFYSVFLGTSKSIDTKKEDMHYEHQLNMVSLYRICGNIILYKPDPNKLDRPAPVGRGAQIINADASNLIAFFDYIRDEKPQVFAQIRADLNKCVSEFTEINFQSVEPTEELIKIYGPATYKRIGLTDGKKGVIYWADELSEGTLYFIALLCIINQPNPPKILLLEEPEKGIHPRRIEEIINFIFALAEDKDIQVIMTTHSPVVVDMFKDLPESVFIFDKDDEGATHIKNLYTDIIQPETEESKRLGIDPPQYLNGLGEAWKVGFLGGVPR